MQTPVEWLLTGPAWVRYRTWRDLLSHPEIDLETASSRREMLDSPQVQSVIRSLSDWPGEVLSSHRSAGQPFHRLNFIADLGLTVHDPGVAEICEKVMAQPSPEGPFRLPTNVAEAHGGSGQDTLAWALCDAPLTVYALAKMGMDETAPVKKALAYLTGLVRENGWPCAVSAELGDFRGPGRKTDPCPFANLAMLKALSQSPASSGSVEAQTGVETLLGLWEHRREQHPYMFYMGTDFCKLKAPLVWYDLLHVLDVLSLFPSVVDDPRFCEMLDVLRSKADPQGRYTAESVYSAWKDWDFGQKKTASFWITFLALRIQHRAEEAAQA